MPHPNFESLLDAARDAHETQAALSDFCAFPTDLIPFEVAPYHIAASDLMVAETGFSDGSANHLRSAFIKAAPQAQWRETYWQTDISQDFKDRFACYCLIGAGGAWMSNQMAAYVVYMPPHLYYPSHHHPAEELYYVIGGEADFHREGLPSKRLSQGDSCFHAANQPHAMETKESPVMAYVLWRNEFQTSPVWSDPNQT